jgi:hypothetical protein
MADLDLVALRAAVAGLSVLLAGRGLSLPAADDADGWRAALAILRESHPDLLRRRAEVALARLDEQPATTQTETEGP